MKEGIHTMIDQEKRTWAEISLGNIRHNYHAIRAQLPEGCRFLGVVKADAYGHGAVRVSRLLQEEGADYLAVACLDEALELRQNGIDMPLLILGVTPAEYTAQLIEHDITQAVGSYELAEAFSREAERLGKTLRIHIKVDSGMSRTGFLASGTHFADCTRQIAAVCRMGGLDAEGIFTHFAVSDESDEDDVRYTEEQFALFCRVIDAVQADRAFRFRIRHCMNTGAAENYPAFALDMARPGLLLYGYGDVSGRFGLRPGMSLKTRTSRSRTMTRAPRSATDAASSRRGRPGWRCSASAMPTGSTAPSRASALSSFRDTRSRSAGTSAWTCVWPM